MIKKVALCGFKGVGKDYVGTILHNVFGFETTSFVQPIKELVIDTFNLESLEEYDIFKRSTFEVFGREVSGRDVVRNIGMKVRESNVNFFTDNIIKQTQNNNKVVITDLRFMNEYEWCRQHGFLICKITSDITNEDVHITEQGIPDDLCDVVLHNTFDVAFNCSIINYFKTITTRS